MGQGAGRLTRLWCVIMSSKSLNDDTGSNLNANSLDDKYYYQVSNIKLRPAQFDINSGIVLSANIGQKRCVFYFCDNSRLTNQNVILSIVQLSE